MEVNPVEAVPDSIFSATDACRRSFEGCLTIKCLINHEWAENRLADFNLWAAGVGASVKNRASLDERLAFEPEARAVVTNLLITLKAFIEECKELGLKEDGYGGDVESASAEDGSRGSAGIEAISPEEPIPRSFSPWSDASSSDLASETTFAITSSNPSLAEAIRSTEAILDQLARLAVAIRKSGTTSRLQKADRSFDPKDHEDLRNHLALILLARSPGIGDRRREFWDTCTKDKSVNFGVDTTQLNTVQQRLVDANLRRRNRFIYAQHHARKLAAVQVSPTPELVAYQLDNEPQTTIVESGPQRPTEETKSIQERNVAVKERLKTTPNAAEMTDTTASAVGTTIMIDVSKTSTPSQQAMTQASSTGSKLTYPNPPKINGLNSFKCPCCCQTFPAMFAEGHRWRKHIAQDLCPYTCPFNDCLRPEVLYITREAWMNHVQKEHQSSQYWECFVCDRAGRIFGVEAFIAHMREHQTISDAHIPTLIDVCSQMAPPDITSCPLCTWAEDQVGNVDRNALLDHVAEHVHIFSLMSLPWAAATNEEDKRNFDRSVEKVRDWFAGWPTTEKGEEHYPVLEITHSTQEEDNYFRQNDYFAESSECSSLAQMESHTLDGDSEGLPSLNYSSGRDSGSTASESEFIGATHESISYLDNIADESLILINTSVHEVDHLRDGTEMDQRLRDLQSTDPQDSMVKEERLVIGIDYGTTYTGVAFCHGGRRGPAIRDIHLITDWPGRYRNATEEKVPSEVAYFDQRFEWGNRIDSYRKREAWTKLLLDESQTDIQLKLSQGLLTGDVDPVQDDRADDINPAPHPVKEPVEIISDFFSGIRTHLQSTLETRYGKILSLLKKEVVIAVPAMWSDKAKHLTYKAICNAGFNVGYTKISMITEPEAAVNYVLRDLKDGPFSNIRVGDHFVVCDAGGATVDVITYRVDSINPTFKIKEVVVGTGKLYTPSYSIDVANDCKGAKCGAAFVDRNFKSWLRRRLGDEIFNKIRKEKLNAGSKMMNEFELAKISFAGDDQISYVYMPPDVGIVNDTALGIIDQEIRIGSEHMREIFDPCVDKILTLIDGQIGEVTLKGAKVKYILLVGGFGKSNYLMKRIKELYNEREIELIRPTNPWSAVVRGAVIAGFDPLGDSLVQLRLCRRHYGTSVLEKFDENIHAEEDKFLEPHSGVATAKGCMRWLISKGDPLLVSAPKKAFVEVHGVFAKDQPRIFYVPLFAWDGDDPPRREKDNPYKVCVLRADLSNVPPEEFISQNGAAGDLINIAKCKIEITIEGSVLSFSLLFGDKSFGSVTEKYV